MKTNFKKEIKTFYRIEYKDTGYGMYMSYKIGAGVSEEHCKYFMNMKYRHLKKLPTFYTDEVINKHIKNYEKTNWRFCFNSLDDLKRLITKNEIKLLDKLGYKIFIIQSDKYVISPYQAIIDVNSIINKKEIKL